MIKIILGLLMVLGGIVLGVYVGGWVCFIGGIVDVINAIKADDIEAIKIAIGVFKFCFAGVIGTISGMFLVIPGALIVKTA
jgi:hypothetical protein